MSLDTWFRDDVIKLLLAIARARAPLTTNEIDILEAVATGFGLMLDFKQFLKR